MTNKGKPGNVEVAEQIALGLSLEKYGAHLKLTQRVYNFIGRWSSSGKIRPFAEITLAERVSVALLYRLTNDLRCVQELAVKGYSLQAVSLASSMFEGAYTLAYIGNDNDLAKEWVEHSDPTRTFRPVKKLVKGVLEKEGVPNLQAATDAKYKDYRQLCLAKHINPLLQKQHGIGKVNEDDKTIIFFSMGPDAESDAGIRTAWFALEQAAILSLMAFSSYLREVPSDEVLTDSAKEQMREMALRHKDLRKRAMEKWGSEDPFPDKW